MGKYRPNAFGLYDMHGNAFEWCSDWYNQNYYSNSPVNDPKGSDTGSSRALRGGGFYVTPVALRCAARSAADPSYRAFDYGFRLVCNCGSPSSRRN